MEHKLIIPFMCLFRNPFFNNLNFPTLKAIPSRMSKITCEVINKNVEEIL